MVYATPVAVERAFADRGVFVSRVGSSPELCDRVGCSRLVFWGGTGKVAYLAPKHGKDFMIVLLPTVSDARHVGASERSTGIATATRGSTLLVYLKSSSRIARLRAALAAVR